MPQASSVFDQAVTFFRAHGLNNIATSGILGNWAVEAPGFNTSAWNPREGALGLAQWEGDRLVKLREFAAGMGLPVTDPRVQLQYAWTEMVAMGLPSQLNSAGSPAQAATIVDTEFERSAGTTRAERIAHAQQFYASNFQNVPGTTGGTPAAAPAPVTGSADTIANFKFPGQGVLTGTVKDLQKMAGAALGPLGSIIGSPLGSVKTATQGLENIGKDLASIAAVFSAMLWLTQPSSWLRIGAFAIGTLFLGFGVYLLATARG